MSSRSKRAPLHLIALALAGAIALPAAAQPLLEIWNTAGCGLTGEATFTVDQPIRLDRIEVWYNWRANETAVPYTTLLDNKAVSSGTLTRADCDPFQRAWCIARDEPQTVLPAGAYTFRTQRAAICQNAGSGGHGFLRVFGEAVEIRPPAPPAVEPLR
jgi:hypothetical protein